MLIRPFSLQDIPEVKKFTDQQIGEGYYSESELIDCQKKSTTITGEITSFVLVDDNGHIQGLRLAYPPGNWAHGKGNKLRPDLWPFPIEKAGYFQSLFISEAARGSGYGPRLSQKSIDLFKKLGTLGIVTHCWKESPNNSSFRYLMNVGFKKVIEHPDYWKEIQYTCTRDGYPCRCTAIVMAKEL